MGIGSKVQEADEKQQYKKNTNTFLRKVHVSKVLKLKIKTNEREISIDGKRILIKKKRKEKDMIIL